jgi:hypothetical protein
MTDEVGPVEIRGTIYRQWGIAPNLGRFRLGHDTPRILHGLQSDPALHTKRGWKIAHVSTL